MENRFSFDYQHYDSPEGMPAGDRELVEEARRAVARAYAPYSKSVSYTHLTLPTKRIV